MEKFFKFLILSLPTAWIFGVQVNDVAAISSVFLLIYGFLNFNLLKEQQLRSLSSAENLDDRLGKALYCFVIAFNLYTLFLPIAETYLGRHGVDFSIFVQVIDSISRRGAPLSSLLSYEWRNFLSHHFTPYLFLPGLFGFLGIPAFLSASIAHALSILFCQVAVWLTATRVFNFNKKFALFCVCLLIANPTFRHGVMFGIHDELFALPFIGFAYFAFLTHRHFLVALMLVLASMTKESLFLVVSAFAAMCLIDFWIDKTTRQERKTQLLYIGLFLYGLVGFVLYAFLQPLILGKNFDHMDKLASISEILGWASLSGKLYFLVFLLGPFLALPLAKYKRAHYITPCIPLLLIILLSRFDEMWKPMNYYGVLPTYIFGFGSLICLGKITKGRGSFPLSNYLCALLIATAFSFSGKKPLQTIRLLSSQPLLAENQLSFISDTSKVIVSPAASLMLHRTNIIWRIFYANMNPPNDFDYVVTRASERNEISSKLIELTTPCHPSELWLVLCRTNTNGIPNSKGR